MGTRFDRDAENLRQLRLAEMAIAAHDFTRARATLYDLHTYAHDDAHVHAMVHRLDFRMARAEKDSRAMVSEVLPILFASTIARIERRSPATEHEVFVNAPRDVVYRVLTDFDAYTEWNPWITHAHGGAHVGDAVDAEVRLGARSLRVGHRVLAATPNERFAWCDTGWFTPAARGRRMRTLVAEGAGTRLHTRLAITGPLAALVWAIEGTNMCEGLAAESTALAGRAERIAGRDGASIAA